jgi:NOL1/NOP2/fmu family ribosome biogenesis protein
MFDQWGTIDEAASWYAHKQQLALFAASIPEAWRPPAHLGIEAAIKFGDHWQPAHPLALLNPIQTSTPKVQPFLPHHITELSDQEAQTYFTGTSIHRPGPSGWQVVTWRARPLGWAKQVGTQLKNHLPKPLRQPALRIDP